MPVLIIFPSTASPSVSSLSAFGSFACWSHPARRSAFRDLLSATRASEGERTSKRPGPHHAGAHAATTGRRAARRVGSCRSARVRVCRALSVLFGCSLASAGWLDDWTASSSARRDEEADAHSDAVSCPPGIPHTLGSHLVVCLASLASRSCRVRPIPQVSAGAPPLPTQPACRRAAAADTHDTRERANNSRWRPRTQ
jgi:hypothetical protein